MEKIWEESDQMAGGTPLGNMRIKLELDDAQFGRGVANSKKQITYLSKEMQANMKIADMAGNTQAKLGTKFESLSKIIQAQEKQVADLKREYEESFVKGQATDSTKRLAGELQNANGKLANYKKQLIDTAGAMAEWQVKNEGLTGAIYKGSEKMINAGEKMSSLGGKLTTGLTLPIIASAGAATKAAIDWESAFAGVKKTNDEVTDSNGNVVYSYADLEAGLRDLAKQLPSSHSEIAAVAEAAGQLGIQTENVKSFTKTMIDMGESTNLSAETAATEMARFANITQMSQEKFSNLGSAIVDLGNNFATTESEISAMALRLAGAGSQIGMSEGDILGFAAALSSVGIEAEAGGSAFSKVMINMQLAVEKGIGSFDELIDVGSKAGLSLKDISVAVQMGGKNLKETAGQMGLTNTQLRKMYNEADKSAIVLQNFANVAGLTNAEFADMFKQNPADAIMKFVEGLAHAEEKGTSAIKVLDDMDIKEVRLRDSLLRAANASGVFSEAVGKGNDAFRENTALTEEANKRYETTESKLKLLKNEVVDLAIDMGGPFVDALRDTVQAGKPVIQFLSEGAKAFKDLDPKTQQAIVKVVAFTAAAGPLLKITGKVTGGIGTLGKSFVELSAAMAKKKAIAEVTKQMAQGSISAGNLSKVLASGTDDVLKFGSAAGTAAGGKGVGALAASIGGGASSAGGSTLIGGMGAIAAPAAIAVGAIGAIALTAYAGVKAYEAHQLAGGKWGTKVTKEQDKVITSAYELREKGIAFVNEYSDGVRGAADKAIKANQEIADSIQQALDKELERKKKAAETLEDPESKENAEKAIKWQEQVNKKYVEQAQKRVDRINQVLADASKNNRNLSDVERNYIENNYKQLSDKQLQQAGFSKEQRIAIETAYQDNLEKLSTKQLRERTERVRKGLQEEKASYSKQSAALEEIYGKDTVAYNKEMAKLDISHKRTTESMILGIAKLGLAQGKTISDMAATWYEYGWSVDEVNTLIDSSINQTSKNVEMLAKGTHEADIQWNQMALDPKTGEIRTNMADVLKETAETETGWQQLKFMVKNADISTNAKEEVAIAMGEVGKWDNLYPTDKSLLVENDDAMLKLYDSINKLGLWNQYNTDRKTLGVDNANAVYLLMEAKGKLEAWNGLPPETKTLIADNPAKLTIEQTEKALKSYNDLPEDFKTLLAQNTNAVTNIGIAKSKLDVYNETKVGVKHLHATADTSAVDSMKTAIASIPDNTIKNIWLKTQVDDSASKTLYNKGVHGTYAKGTNYHPGGAMIVNDQAGPIYKEIVQEPGKEPYIPFGRNVLIPNAKRGTKVFKASQTKTIMSRMGIPKYAEGTGIPKNSSLVKKMTDVTNQSESIISTNITFDNTNLEDKVDKLISIMSNFGNDLKNMKILLDGKDVTKTITTRQNHTQKIDRLMRGERI